MAQGEPWGCHTLVVRAAGARGDGWARVGPRPHRPVFVLLLAVVALLGVPSCGSPGARGGSRRPTDGVAAPTTTAPVAASTAAPLRVLIVGDSVMDNVAEALVPALEPTGAATVSHQWLLGLTRDAASRHEVRRAVAEGDPDVVIVLMGVWELEPVADEVSAPGWAARYGEEVLDPFVDEVTARGAQVLWLGMPATSDPTVTAGLDVLDAAYRELDRRDPRVWFVDLGSVLDGPTGAYAEARPGAGGVLERVRQTDGLHLCPQGTVRAVRVVLDRLEAQWGVEAAPGWEAGAWRATQGIEADGDRCPGD